MMPVPPYTEVKHVEGNCIIITALRAIPDAPPRQQRVPPLAPSVAQPVKNLDHQWLPPHAASAHLNYSMSSDAIDTSPVKMADLCFCHSCPVHKYVVTDAEQGQSVIRDSAGVQTLLPTNTDLPLAFSSVKRGKNLGPLVMVRRSREASAFERTTPLSDLEKLSYRREVDGLRNKLKEMEGVLTESQERAEGEICKRLKCLEDNWREEERSRRQRFQEALSKLRVENEELSTRIQNMEESGRLVATDERDKIQKEWSSRFSVNDQQWRERYRVAQERWEGCVENHMQREQDALQKVQELAHAVEELEATLRTVTREKEWTENERDALLQSRPKMCNSDLCEQKNGKIHSEVLDVLEAEVLMLRSALRDAESREKALMTQLEVCGTENAEQEATLEHHLQQMRQELEAERRRGSDLVALYSSQVESLHQQLNDSMRRNKQLTKELAIFQQ